MLAAGRLKPLDTVARNSLVIIRGRQTLRLEDGETLSATRWLADMLFKPSVADRYPSFAINNPEVLGLFGWQQGDRKYFSYGELEPYLQKIDDQGQQAARTESAQRSSFQTAIYNLRNTLIVYQQLQHSLRPEAAEDFASELEAYEKIAPAAMDAMKNGEKASAVEKEKLGLFSKLVPRYREMAQASSIQPGPSGRCPCSATWELAFARRELGAGAGGPRG